MLALCFQFLLERSDPSHQVAFVEALQRIVGSFTSCLRCSGWTGIESAEISPHMIEMPAPSGAARAAVIRTRRTRVPVAREMARWQITLTHPV
jgi:hypothetical protein